MTRTKIVTKRARDIVARYGVEKPPVPVADIAKQLGIMTRYVALDDELSGMAFIRNGEATIIINSGHHPNRQRFTLAHELAHHVLHADYLSKTVHVDKAILKRDRVSQYGIDHKEIEANAFAAELLMPVSLMRSFKHIDVNDEGLVSKIAKQFKVSSAALTYRLINLA